MSLCTSKSLCRRVMCCLKLSARGQRLFLFGQYGAAHFHDLPTGLCKLFWCLTRSLDVVKPFFQLQFGSSQMNGLSCLSLCFLHQVNQGGPFLMSSITYFASELFLETCLQSEISHFISCNTSMAGVVELAY